MNEGEDVRNYLKNFMDIVDKLHEMDMEINEDLLVIILLYSLPDKYENFRCAMECRDQLPTMEYLTFLYPRVGL